MKKRYIMYIPKQNRTRELDRETFDKILFNETILEVRHRTITSRVSLIIYEMLKYNVYNDSTELFYLIYKRSLEV